MKINRNLIKELTECLEEFELAEIEYSEKDIKVKVSKFSGTNVSTSKEIRSDLKSDVVKSQKISGTEIPSPIIGTAYLSPEPGAKKFVEVGQKIKKGETVMIVEAMKTMNHVPSTHDGIVEEIYVKDNQPVEYGQVLIILK